MPMVKPRARSTQVVIGCTLAAALLVAGCGGSDAGSAATTTKRPHPTTTTSQPAGDTKPAAITVEVNNMKFAPADVTVKTGDTVTWHFADKAPHTVQGIGDKAMGLNSPIIDKGDWSYTFTVAGTYRYLCSLHPEMRGTITVQ
ncbi:plastocyanin/azurin family copper-binding protein [Nocardia sp. NPDC046473]|uniref:plastocyanin/azurin family copper-binding protein n=1 Tax=Nocardia sp. NPDC046473 TaxID=3155733 RepID=UPI0033E098C4